MSIKHMKIFLEVYRIGNITRAAEQLHMTQPAVSRAIQEIERYYGVVLFERRGRRLVITESSRQLYAQALHIVSVFDQMEKGLRNWDEVGVLRVGASITIGNYLMPQLIHTFQERHPQLRVTVQIANSAKLQQALIDNQIDLAFIEGTIEREHLVSEVFEEDHLVLILPPKHALCKKKCLQMADLEGQNFLLREAGSAGRTYLEHVFDLHEMPVAPLWESASTQALVKAVAEGIGISILPEQLVRADVAAGRVVSRSVADEEFGRTYSIVWYENKYLTASAKELIALGKNKC